MSNTSRKDSATDAAPKVGFFRRLRNKFRIKISIQVGDKAAPDAAPDLAPLLDTPASPPSILQPDPNEGPVDRTTAKKKKQKKPKPKKVKAAKPQKVKRTKVKKAAKDKAGPNVKAIVLIALIVLLVGGGATTAFLLLRGGGTPEARFAKAQGYTENGKYEKALDLYTELIGEDELVVESYLGIADTYVALDDGESVLPRLQLAYSVHEDDRLAAKYEEIAGFPLGGEDPESNAESGATPSAPADHVIQWQDPAFERMVRLATGIPDGQDIRPSDLSAITTLRILGTTHAIVNESGSDSRNVLSSVNHVDGYEVDGVEYTERGDIRSLADAANFPNLTRLTVAYNSISSLDGVQSMPRLEMLNVSANNIRDLSPLSGCSGLRYLYAYGNQISDLSPLSALDGLEGLQLQYNEISDLSPLSSLTALVQLRVGNNAISDISPLSSLSSLKYLIAQNNNIGDLSALTELRALTDINFEGNPVSDYSAAQHVQNINKSTPDPANF